MPLQHHPVPISFTAYLSQISCFVPEHLSSPRRITAPAFPSGVQAGTASRPLSFPLSSQAEYTDVVLEPSEEQQAMVEALGKRAEIVRNGGVDASVDNMLKITNDGRKLALDQRLNNPLLPDNPDSKTNACVKNVFSIWQDTAKDKAAQLVFCDLSTPKGDGEYLRSESLRF